MGAGAGLEELTSRASRVGVKADGGKPGKAGRVMVRSGRLRTARQVGDCCGVLEKMVGGRQDFS